MRDLVGPVFFEPCELFWGDCFAGFCQDRLESGHDLVDHSRWRVTISGIFVQTGPHIDNPVSDFCAESTLGIGGGHSWVGGVRGCNGGVATWSVGDRKSTRLNSSHVSISYAVFCLKKKTKMMR